MPARSKLARDAEQFRVGGVGIGCRHFGHFDPLGPFYFERRRCEKQRPGKMAAVADRRLRDRLFAGERRHALRQLGRRHVIAINVVDRAGDGRPQSRGRESGNLPDAGNAAGQFRPVGSLADAKRGDETDAGDSDNWTAELVSRFCGHRFFLQPARSISARPSPRQLAIAVTTTCDRSGGPSPASAGPLAGYSLPWSIAAQPIARLARNWASTPWPI